MKPDYPAYGELEVTPGRSVGLLERYTPDELVAMLEEADGPTREALAEGVLDALHTYRYTWENHARPKQLPPVGDWLIWLILAGRGWGKTLTGAQWLRKKALSIPNSRWAIVAPTFSDVRDTCIEGETGLLSVLPPEEYRDGDPDKAYNASTSHIYLANGAQIKGYAAEVPNRLRGPQFHGAWLEELAAWRYTEAWDNLQFGLRLGVHPQMVITTTPKPVPLITNLVKRDSGLVITTGNTFENEANLAPSAIAELRTRYEGTRLGRQELYAEILTDVEGAYWTAARIEATRITLAEVPDLTRIVVAVDPSGGSGKDNDEQGIVVAGKSRITNAEGIATDHAYVLADRSCLESPDGWARRAIAAYQDYSADAVIVEKNFGGDMAVAVIETAAKAMGVEVNVKTVTASRGKRVRAEPAAALFEQHRAHVVGNLDALEDQLTTWTPDSGKSPDRLDAMVWALNELMEPTATPAFLGAA